MGNARSINCFRQNPSYADCSDDDLREIKTELTDAIQKELKIIKGAEKMVKVTNHKKTLRSLKKHIKKSDKKSKELQMQLQTVSMLLALSVMRCSEGSVKQFEFPKFKPVDDRLSSESQGDSECTNCAEIHDIFECPPPSSPEALQETESATPKGKESGGKSNTSECLKTSDIAECDPPNNEKNLEDADAEISSITEDSSTSGSSGAIKSFYDEISLEEDTLADVSEISEDEPDHEEVSVEQPFHLKLEHFNLLSVIGRGSFGKIFSAAHTFTGELFALKAISKENTIMTDNFESIFKEKRIWETVSRIGHPFLLNLYAAFQTPSHLCFVMEYLPAGDLFMFLRNDPFSPSEAAFYAACMVLGIEALHQNNIVHRDLKLCNVLLTNDGYAKICDFGISEDGIGYGDKMSEFYGVCNYMAPEIRLCQEYTRAIDWWTLGIVIYNLITCEDPFNGRTDEELHNNIISEEPIYPLSMDPDAKDIIIQLLKKNPEERLGSGESDAEELKIHPFFKDIDWNLLLEKKLQPPFVPDPQLYHMSSGEEPVLTPSSYHLQEDPFENFDYVSDYI